MSEQGDKIPMMPKHSLRIGDDDELSAVIQKGLNITLDEDDYFRETLETFKIAFPDLPLVNTRESGEDFFYAVFDNEEQLVEFKLRYL